ncbi:hypothetical protein HK097_001712 [Rhizophlyctis rosea]|uniref:Uncharacterized protein n=1 Tax=Rhizophlyctis rosea TaxID=64517 RepID=A0AAD5X1P5_9FUNG|nr:hypothetical protein HK097_001712 [Rhizophlyctis rosea]
MRREGSRYGLKPTNKSLKHDMQYFEDVKGCVGLITLPTSSTPLPLKKQSRWKHLHTLQFPNTTPLPTDTIRHGAYHTRGTSPHCSPKVTALQKQGHPIAYVDYIGRYEDVSHRKAMVNKNGDFVCDMRWDSFGGCCGCSMCSLPPRNKAKKKTKGRRKHEERFQIEDYDY